MLTVSLFIVLIIFINTFIKIINKMNKLTVNVYKINLRN